MLNASLCISEYFPLSARIVIFKRPTFFWNIKWWHSHGEPFIYSNADLSLSFLSFQTQLLLELRFLSETPAPGLPLVNAQQSRDAGLVQFLHPNCSLLGRSLRASMQTITTLWSSHKLLLLGSGPLDGSWEGPASPPWEQQPAVSVSTPVTSDALVGAHWPHFPLPAPVILPFCSC